MSDEPAEAPAAADLVVPPAAEPHDVLVVLDRHDEQMILEEFQRRALRVMLYDFTLEGRSMIDLSYAGVREAVHLMNRTGKCRIGVVGGPENMVVRELNESPRDDKDPAQYIEATVWARDDVTGETYSGTSLEPKFFKTRKGEYKWDTFARTKAINKAERNALKKHIPEPMRQTMIAQYKGDDAAVRQIQAGAGAEAMAELPPPLTDQKAKQLIHDAKGIYQEIREVSPTAVLPAVFHAYLSRAEHSHERLADFISYLEAKLEEVRDAGDGVDAA